MDRREIQRRRLAVESMLNSSSALLCQEIGRVGCHDIEPDEIIPGEEYYEVRMNTDTGDITVTPFIGGDTGLLHE